MILKTDAIGHFDMPTEDNIREAFASSANGELIKLMSDDEHYLSIWFGKPSIGHTLTFKSGPWKHESAEKQSSEMVVNLMLKYLFGDLSPLKELQWTRPLDQVFLDNITKLR